MKHSLSTFCLALAAFGVGGVTVVDAQEDPAMIRLQALGVALQTRATWSASYTQEYVSAGMTFGEEVEGEVWVSWQAADTLVLTK